MYIYIRRLTCSVSYIDPVNGTYVVDWITLSLAQLSQIIRSNQHEITILIIRTMISSSPKISSLLREAI